MPLSYVSRAQKIFDEDSTTNNLMEEQVKSHYLLINKTDKSFTLVPVGPVMISPLHACSP